MSILNLCPTCKCMLPIYSTLSHVCPPIWLVFVDEFGDSPYMLIDQPEGHKFYADDAEEAVEKFCKRNNELPSTMSVFVIGYIEAHDIAADFDYDAHTNSDLDENAQEELYAEKVNELILAKAEKFNCEAEIVRDWYIHKDKKHEQERSG